MVYFSKSPLMLNQELLNYEQQQDWHQKQVDSNLLSSKNKCERQKLLDFGRNF